MELLGDCGVALTALKMSIVDPSGLGTMLELMLHDQPTARALAYTLLAQGGGRTLVVRDQGNCSLTGCGRACGCGGHTDCGHGRTAEEARCALLLLCLGERNPSCYRQLVDALRGLPSDLVGKYVSVIEFRCWMRLDRFFMCSHLLLPVAVGTRSMGCGLVMM